MASLFSMSYTFLHFLVTFSAEISCTSYKLRSKFFSGRLKLSVQPFLSYPSMSKCCLGNLSRSTFCVFRFNSRWFKFKPPELCACVLSGEKHSLLWDMTGWGLHSIFCLYGVWLWRDLLKSWKILWVSTHVVVKYKLFFLSIFSSKPSMLSSRFEG